MFEKVIQLQGTLNAGDAIGGNVEKIARSLSKNNIPNTICAYDIDPNYPREGLVFLPPEHLFTEVNQNTLILFHFSGKSLFTSLAIELNCPKIMIYHNITPPIFFEEYNATYTDFSLQGLRELDMLSLFMPKSLGDSEYNSSELRKAGFKNVDTLPLTFDFKKFQQITPEPNIIKNGNQKDILFVGRVAPNKRQADVIQAFYYYQKINPNSVLHIVGNYLGFENYLEELQKLSEKLNVKVNFTGKTSDAELAAYYKNADLFLSMSEHEGFCVPILEAMSSNTPVLAFASSAVIETVGDAGILFHEKKFVAIAELMNVVLTDSKLQENLIKAGHARLSDFSDSKLEKQLLSIIESYADELNI